MTKELLSPTNVDISSDITIAPDYRADSETTPQEPTPQHSTLLFAYSDLVMGRDASYESLDNNALPSNAHDITAVKHDSLEASINTITSRSLELPANVTGSMNNLVELSSTSVRFVHCYRLITVEFLSLLFFLAMTLTYPVMTAQYLVHTCRATLGFNTTTCASLEAKSSSTLESLVQPKANIYIMAATVIEACLPAVATLFVGPWSDKHGRRMFLTVPLLGYVFKYLLCLVFSLFPTLPPAYLLIASVPVSLSGGMISVISLSYCYITDITTEKRRGFRMGILEACTYIGLLIGTGSSTYLFTYGGYVAVYGTSCTLCLIAFVYGVFFLQESVQTAKSSCCFSGLFNCVLMRDMIRTCVRKRENGGRAIIFLVVLTLSVSIFAMEGEGVVKFLFMRKKFGWDIRDYTTYGSYGIVLNIIGTLLAVSVLSSWLEIDDTWLAIGSFVLFVVGCVVCALSPSWWYLYVASAVSFMGGGAGPFCRSILSKTVEPRDVGKVFSLLSSVEAVTPLAAAPLYTLVYNMTIMTFPGMFFLMSAGFFILNILLLGVVAVIKHRHSQTGYTSLLAE